jgi:hypothetical protein
MKITATMETMAGQPDADWGYISWFDVAIGHDDDNDDTVVGEARVAVIHADSARSELYDALDADSGELEALYSIYFDPSTHRLKSEFSRLGASNGVLYVSEFGLVPGWTDRNVGPAVIERLCRTVASGCAIIVIEAESDEQRKPWESMGFCLTDPDGDFMHMPLTRLPSIIGEREGAPLPRFTLGSAR